MSRRAAVLGFAVAFVAGLVTLVVAGSRATSWDRLTTGNFPAQLMAILRSEGEACQRPLRLPDPVDRIRLVVAPANEVRGPVEVEVRRLGDPEAASGPVLAAGRLSRRRLSGGPEVVGLDRTVRTDDPVAVCVTKSGPEDVEVWGQGGPESPARTVAYEDGRALGGDLFLEFPRPEPASVLSRLPEAFRHAAPFKLGFAGAWLFWLLGGLAVVAVPAGLAYALTRAADDDNARS